MYCWGTYLFILYQYFQIHCNDVLVNFIGLFVSLQIMWARQLKGANASYQILTIGDSTHINDNRFLITKSTINNVISLLTIHIVSE